MRTVSVIFLFLFMIGGCGRIPEPIGYKHSEQHKMQAAYHWEILAKDVANQINNELIITTSQKIKLPHAKTIIKKMASKPFQANINIGTTTKTIARNVNKLNLLALTSLRYKVIVIPCIILPNPQTPKSCA